MCFKLDTTGSQCRSAPFPRSKASSFLNPPPFSHQSHTLHHAAEVSVATDPHAHDDTLVGRETELAEIQALIDDPDSPLVVLTGPGGIGKSRLAATAVARERDRRMRTAVLIDLGLLPADRTDLVLVTIAAALGLDLPGNTPNATVLGEAIGDRPLLLTLDGMEHLVAAGPDLTALLRVAPQLTILVTSQTVLDVYGERVYPVAPISFPASDDVSRRSLTLDEALTFDAVRLFVQRAFGSHPLPAFTPTDIAGLLAIAARLEGHPLAIELAASHYRTSGDSLSVLAEALSRELLPVPESGATGQPAPDMSPLQRTLARSYARLEPAEQAAFRRASVLGGAWTVADTVPVLALGDEGTTADSIALLLDASLIRMLPSSEGAPRMHMLAPLREFGARLLDESGETASTDARHATSVLAFAEAAAPELTGAAQREWLDRIDDRLPDVRRAFAWFARFPDSPADAQLRLAAALWWFGYSRGSLRESIGWLETALANTPESHNRRLRGRALNALGLLVGMGGDRDRAQMHYGEALAIGRELGNDDLIGWAYLGLGEQAVARQDLTTAHHLIQRASSHLARSNDLRAQAVVLTNLANVLWSMGRLAEADALHHDARARYERIGDERGVAWSVTNLGRIALQQDKIAAAIPLLHDALHRYVAGDDRVGIVETLDALARCAFATGDIASARKIVATTDRTREELHYPVPEIDRAEDAIFRARLQGEPAAPDETSILSLEDAIALGHGIDAGALPPAPAMPEAPSTLSPREMEVLALLKQGKSNQEISDELFIGVRTVQSHVLHIMRKLDASSRVAAVAIAMQQGILPPDA
ncbi:MAG: LuxR C-terminal-related transcriptional regulator [Thermomicrobiales bacterium]